MPAGRPRNHAAHLKVAGHGLVEAMNGLLATLGAGALRLPPEMRHAQRTGGQRGAGKGNPRLKSAVKASWASYTPAQRKARVARMLAGRGLKPKRG